MLKAAEAKPMLLFFTILVLVPNIAHPAFARLGLPMLLRSAPLLLCVDAAGADASRTSHAPQKWNRTS